MINFRSFKFLDMEEFRKDLEEAVWFKQNVTGIDEVYDNWHTECMRIVDKHLPLKRVKARMTDVPYMMGEWKEAIRKKRKYAKKFSQSKTKENMELMKKWCNNATRLRRKAIKNYWNAICEDMNNNPRKLYNTFTPFLRTKPKKDKSIISLTIQGVTHQDQSLVAQEFTNFFCSIADHIGGTDVCGLTEVLCYQHQSIPNIAARHAPNTFSFRRLNRDEVLAALREINPRKATGYDMIPPRVLKMAAEQLATPLTTIFNQAIEENCWPSAWKRGEWIPIYKKEDPLDKVNYRPVTMVTDKIFEKLICRQLGEKFEPILDTFLSAYRKHFSCETTLIRLTEDWKYAADKGHASVVLSTDMSKAFDSLHPKLLLTKLKTYGLSDPALRLMRLYFDDRENRTRVGNYRSGWKAVKQGCPGHP